MDETVHFGDMLKERGIKREWVDRTIRAPDRTEEHDDGDTSCCRYRNMVTGG